MQIGGRGVWLIGTVDVESFIEQAYRLTEEKIKGGDLSDDEAEAPKD
jgi:hypothetical protein